MKKILIYILIINIFAGCGGLLTHNKGVTGVASRNEDKQKDKINSINTIIKTNSESRLDTIGEFSWGTDYILSKTTNTSPQIEIAKEFNLRIQTLANKPTLEQIKEIQKLADLLMESNSAAIKLLNDKDKSIIELQRHGIQALQEKDALISKYMELAEKTARQADQYKQTISDMDSFWGVSAIWYGIKKFISRAAIGLGIVAVIFIILRLLSTVNPIASSIFGIFEHIVSWAINTIAVLFPKALNMAGHITKDIYMTSHNLLKKLVDNIQFIKETEKKLGRDMTIRELLDSLKLDSSETAIINNLKQELGYK